MRSRVLSHDIFYLTHLFSLDPKQQHPPAWPLLPLPPSDLVDATYQTGGQFVQVMHCRQLLMFPSRRAKRCAQPLFIVFEVSSINLQRTAAAGAPKRNHGYRHDEDFDTPPPPPNSDPQRTSAPVQIDTGEHGSCLCF
jgi:hypothetical protein